MPLSVNLIFVRATKKVDTIVPSGNIKFAAMDMGFCSNGSGFDVLQLSTACPRPGELKHLK
jgi:hypothetical protein